MRCSSAPKRNGHLKVQPIQQRTALMSHIVLPFSVIDYNSQDASLTFLSGHEMCCIQGLLGGSHVVESGCFSFESDSVFIPMTQ